MKIGSIRWQAGGQYFFFGISRNAGAIVLKPLKAPLSEAGSGGGSKGATIKGEKIYCQCGAKPPRPLLVSRTGGHRGSAGIIKEDAKARILRPFAFAS